MIITTPIFTKHKKMCHHKFQSSLKTLALFGSAFTHKISPFVCSASERYLLNLSVIISKNQLFPSLVMQTQTVKRALRWYCCNNKRPTTSAAHFSTLYVLYKKLALSQKSKRAETILSCSTEPTIHSGNAAARVCARSRRRRFPLRLKFL